MGSWCAKLWESYCIFILNFTCTSDAEMKYSQGTWQMGIDHQACRLPVGQLNEPRATADSMTLRVLGLKSSWSRTLSVSRQQEVTMMKNSYVPLCSPEKRRNSSVMLQTGSSQLYEIFRKAKKKVQNFMVTRLQTLLQSLNSYFNQSQQTLTLPPSFAVCCGYYLKAISPIQGEFWVSKKTPSTTSRSLWGKVTF